MPGNILLKFKKPNYVLLALSCIPLLLHLYSIAFANYGIFRDEFYYIACSNRLDWGYVDQPPFSICILAINRFLFGDSLFALRLIPSFANAVTVFFTGLIVRKLGGGFLATIIATIAVIQAPIILGMNSIYSMNCLGIMLWSIGAYLMILIITESTREKWILLGVIIGIGALNKIDFIWFGAGVFMGLVFTDQRKHLRTIWPYTAAAIALIIFAPYIIWNITHDLAHIEFIQNATSGKYSSLTRLSFIFTSIMIINPATLIIWLLGIYYYLFSKDGKQFRSLGIIFLTVFLILILNAHSKAEYLSSAFPILFAAGGIMIEKISKLRFWKWIKYAILIPLILSGIIILPNVLPILPVKTYIAYADYWGFKPTTAENKKLSELPQFYADMFGWEDMARSVALVSGSLLPQERAGALVVARNYGQAGALEYYKKKYNLPPVVSGHNNYWLWGWNEIKKNYNTFIVIGGRLQDHLKSCEHVEIAAIHKSQYSMPYENNLTIYICKNLKRPIEEIWKESKHYE